LYILIGFYVSFTGQEGLLTAAGSRPISLFSVGLYVGIIFSAENIIGNKIMPDKLFGFRHATSCSAGRLIGLFVIRLC
jgi:hypothetical protein